MSDDKAYFYSRGYFASGIVAEECGLAPGGIVRFDKAETSEIKVASSAGGAVVLLIDGERYDLAREEALALARFILQAVDENDRNNRPR